jgi:phage FluMu protein Com
MYDFFVAAMKCPSCGSVSQADSSTNMQTYVRRNAEGLEIPVGFQLDAIDAREDRIQQQGYLAVGRGRPDDRTRLIDQWQCPTCKHENWAQITLDGGRVTAIDAVTLDRATLTGAQFITENCFILAGQLSEISGEELTTGAVSPVSVLLDRLP